VDDGLNVLIQKTNDIFPLPLTDSTNPCSTCDTKT
jgi:hypothetical protein